MIRTHPQPDLPAPDGRRRVGILTPALLRGGVERWIADLLEHVSAVQWTGVCLTQPGMEHPDTRATVEATCPVFLGPQGARLLAESCDVLLSWGLDVWPAWVPQAHWPKVVLVSHGSGDWTRHCVADARLAGGCVAVSRQAATLAPRGVECPVIYNGVDPARLLPSSPMAAAEKWVGFLGRLSGEKRPELLLEAAAHLPEWVACFAGEGEGLEPLRQKARDLGIAGRALLLGHVPPADLLQRVSVLCVPSDHEGFGYQIAEALALGVPVVATLTGLAWECPWLVRPIPFGAPGEAIAGQILVEYLAEQENGGIRTPRPDLFPIERFAHDWTEYLTEATHG